MPDKKSLFLITSGIYTPYGKCSVNERIEQTKETLKSIKQYAPSSSIVLLDCGENSIDKNLFDCDIVDYTQNLEIQSHIREYKTCNVDLEPEIIIKSMAEILICEDYFKRIDKNQYDRIFKLCGRYRLNSKFDYQKHINTKDKVLVLEKMLSQHFYTFDDAISIFQYMTRFFSFDSTLLSEMSKTYHKMKEEIIKISKTKRKGDIEHLLYKHLKKNMVETVRVIGIEGYWASLRLWIEE
jgi:hypothetical protein